MVRLLFFFIFYFININSFFKFHIKVNLFTSIECNDIGSKIDLKSNTFLKSFNDLIFYYIEPRYGNINLGNQENFKDGKIDFTNVDGMKVENGEDRRGIVDWGSSKGYQIGADNRHVIDYRTDNENFIEFNVYCIESKCLQKINNLKFNKIYLINQTKYVDLSKEYMVFDKGFRYEDIKGKIDIISLINNRIIEILKNDEIMNKIGFNNDFINRIYLHSIKEGRAISFEDYFEGTDNGFIAHVDASYNLKVKLNFICPDGTELRDDPENDDFGRDVSIFKDIVVKVRNFKCDILYDITEAFRLKSGDENNKIEISKGSIGRLVKNNDTYYLRDDFDFNEPICVDVIIGENSRLLKSKHVTLRFKTNPGQKPADSLYNLRDKYILNRDDFGINYLRKLILEKYEKNSTDFSKEDIESIIANLYCNGSDNKNELVDNKNTFIDLRDDAFAKFVVPGENMDNKFQCSVLYNYDKNKNYNDKKVIKDKKNGKNSGGINGSKCCSCSKCCCKNVKSVGG